MKYRGNESQNVKSLKVLRVVINIFMNVLSFWLRILPFKEKEHINRQQAVLIQKDIEHDAG